MTKIPKEQADALAKIYQGQEPPKNLIEPLKYKGLVTNTGELTPEGEAVANIALSRRRV